MNNNDSGCGLMIFLIIGGIIVIKLFLFLGEGFFVNFGKYLNSPYSKAGANEASLYFIGLVVLIYLVYKFFKK